MIETLEFDNDYYWGVEAIDTGGNVIARSMIWSFRTEEEAHVLPLQPGDVTIIAFIADDDDDKPVLIGETVTFTLTLRNEINRQVYGREYIINIIIDEQIAGITESVDIPAGLLDGVDAIFRWRSLDDGRFSFRAMVVRNDETELIIYETREPVIIYVGDLSEDYDLLPVIYTALVGNFPNPFNPETTIMFSLAEESDVSLEIFNIRGQRVKILVNETLVRGNHTVTWRGTDESGRSVGSGIYFYRMVAGEYTSIKRMLLLK
jgi:hypothetical protein